jgi:type I restriction enzyme M protein
MLPTNLLDMMEDPYSEDRQLARGKRNNNSKSNGATLGFEAILWAAADKLRNNMDAAEYKHVVLGLIFNTTAASRGII